MKVKEIIEKLQGYNPDAEFRVIDDNARQVGFCLSFGNAEGATPETADDVCLYPVTAQSDTPNKEVTGGDSRPVT